MAKKTIIILEDDLDGSTANETINFSLGDSSYEIDLNTSNADKMREVLAPFVAAARKASPATRKANTAKAGTSGTGLSAKDVRAWATEQKLDVNPFGRVAQSVIDAYKAAH